MTDIYDGDEVDVQRVENKKRNRTLEKVFPLICQAAIDFFLAHGGDLEELKSEAVQLFFSGYESYQFDRSHKFSTWIYTTVFRGLLGARRKLINRQRLLGTQVDVTTTAIPNKDASNFNVDSFVNQLTEDARYLVRTVIDCPDELRKRFLPRDHKKAMRKRVREYLFDRGWSPDRVASTFQEISEALEK